MKFKGKDGAWNMYDFVCEGCKAEGQLKVLTDEQHVYCPEQCGAMYIQWHNPVTQSPDLMCVVAPVFEDSPSPCPLPLGEGKNAHGGA